MLDQMRRARWGVLGLREADHYLAVPNLCDLRRSTVCAKMVARERLGFTSAIVHLRIEADHRYGLARMLDVNPGAEVLLGSASDNLYPQRFQDGSLGTRRLDDTFVGVYRGVR